MTGQVADGAAGRARRPRNHGLPCVLERSRSHEIATLVRSDEVNAQSRFALDCSEALGRCQIRPDYFHPVDFRVNREGSGGLRSGVGSGSPAAAAISRSSSSSLGSPAS